MKMSSLPNESEASCGATKRGQGRTAAARKDWLLGPFDPSTSSGQASSGQAGFEPATLRLTARQKP